MNGLKVKGYDKMKALELLGKRRGMFVESHEVDHSSRDGSMSPITKIELISKRPVESSG